MTNISNELLFLEQKSFQVSEYFCENKLIILIQLNKISFFFSRSGVLGLGYSSVALFAQSNHKSCYFL